MCAFFNSMKYEINEYFGFSSLDRLYSSFLLKAEEEGLHEELDPGTVFVFCFYHIVVTFSLLC